MDAAEAHWRYINDMLCNHVPEHVAKEITRLRDAPSRAERAAFEIMSERAGKYLDAHIKQYVAWAVKAGVVQGVLNGQAHRRTADLQTATDVLEELEHLTLIFALAATKDTPNVQHSGVDAGYQRLASQHVWYGLRTATPYLWLDEMRMAAVSSGDLPPHQVNVRLPYPYCWWTYQTDGVPIDCGEISGHAKGVGLLIWKTAGRTSLSCLEFHDSILVTHNVQLCDDGMVYPDDFANPVERANYEAIAKMLVFLESNFILKEPQQATRAYRRRMKRHDGTEDARPVRIVSLRRLASPGAATVGRDGESNREYQWQWLVSGHFRNQWYRRAGEHRVIWISPYIKGPEDKPLKQPAYKVNR